MRYRTAIAAILGLAISASAAFVAAVAQTTPEVGRIAFQIATGPVGGSYFPVGEALARIISNPPGFGRCEDDAGLCGPVGLIASARSTDGPVSNIAAIRAGRVTSALIQGDVAELAFRGAAPFKSAGAFIDMRVIAKLQSETVQLVVSPRARIKRVADLKGKRVSIDAPMSATNITARSILGAARLNTRNVRFSYDTPKRAAEALKAGTIDAFFVVGTAPIHLVEELVAAGEAKLLPIDGGSIAAWVKKQPFLTTIELPAGTYRGSKPIRTVSVTALWVTTASVPDATTFSLARALWNPGNRRELDSLGAVSASIHRHGTLVSSPIPLHPGAAKFYSEAGRLQN